jgi:alpha-D-ribose 1-methylphosphonate 5-triphosphate synthase subunit PhnH
MAEAPSYVAGHARGDQLGRAFSDPVLGAQRCFRLILSAMSEPGTVHALPGGIDAPTALEPSAAQTLLALADPETPVWLSPSLAAAAPYIRFYCSAPIVAEPSAARFAVIDGLNREPRLAAFDAGDDLYPDRSATVIVQCAAMTGGTAVALSGPGIPASRAVAPAGLHAGFWAEAAANHERYPLGVDLILAAGDGILCLPRSTRITLANGVA